MVASSPTYGHPVSTFQAISGRCQAEITCVWQFVLLNILNSTDVHRMERKKVKDEQTDGKFPDSHQAVHLLASRAQPVILRCWIHSMTSYVQHLSGFKLLPLIFFPSGWD